MNYLRKMKEYHRRFGLLGSFPGNAKTRRKLRRLKVRMYHAASMAGPNGELSRDGRPTMLTRSYVSQHQFEAMFCPAHAPLFPNYERGRQAHAAFEQAVRRAIREKGGVFNAMIQADAAHEQFPKDVARLKATMAAHGYHVVAELDGSICFAQEEDEPKVRGHKFDQAILDDIKDVK